MKKCLDLSLIYPESVPYLSRISSEFEHASVGLQRVCFSTAATTKSFLVASIILIVLTTFICPCGVASAMPRCRLSQINYVRPSGFDPASKLDQ